MIKKFSAIVVALMMLLSMSFVVSAEATGTIELTMDPVTVFYDTEATDPILFDVNVVLKGAPSVGAFSFKLDYNKNVIVPVNTGTTDDARLTGKAVANHFGETEGEPNWYVSSETIGDGTFNYVGMFNSTNPLLPTASAEQKFDVPADGLTCYTITFKVKTSGETGLKLTVIDNVCFTLQPTDVVTISSIDVSKVAKINAKPVAPTVESLAASTDAPVEAATVAPTYTFDNGVTDDGADTTLNDGSEVKWYAGTTEIGTTTAKAAFTIPKEAVGKELSYTILPKVNPTRDIAPEGTISEKVVVGTVKAVGTYKPAITEVTLDNGATKDGEILASTAVEPGITYDNTYGDVANYVSAYKWFAVDLTANTEATANDAITAAKAYVEDTETIKAAGTAEKATFDAKTYRNWWAVVEITPSVTITGDEARSGEAFWAAALVTGEPPVLTIDEAKLAKKKIYAGSKFKISDVTATSKVPEGTDKNVKLDYTWYIVAADAVDKYEETTPVGTGETLAVPKDTKEAPVIGKKVVVVVTATDALGITATDSYAFPEAIAQKPASGSVQTGASLVTGGNTVVTPEKPGTEDSEKPGTEEPGTDVPGTEEPAGSEDPAGTANENGAAAFTDVNKEAYAWAYDSIDVLAKAGVIKGMSETTFGPELTTTNAQVIALAVRIAGLTAEEGATTDKVDAEHWVAGEMAIAEANEILGVYGDKVDVEGETTREIAFTLLYNALKAAGVELEETAEAIEFTDAASISEGCAEAIDALVKAGIVNGMGDGTLAPKATLTRAQLAKILGLANALIK